MVEKATEKKSRHQPADFSALRAAFLALSEIYSVNGKVTFSAGTLKLSSIPRDRWKHLSDLAGRRGEMIHSLVSGSGQKSSVAGRREVAMAVLGGSRDGKRYFEVAAFLVIGRGPIHETISLTSEDPQWKEKLLGFTDWNVVEGIIAAAEGNNQRAMIGLVLQMAGIGRGRLDMVEADVPEEIDEAAQVVKGADWLKAGLRRFEMAAGEALWYLMRMRSLHSRMIRIRKQGYYTSMAFAALYASGVGVDRISAVSGLSAGFVDKLLPRPGSYVSSPARFSELGEGFNELDKITDSRQVYCSERVWKGPAIYARVLDRRVRNGAAARRKIGAGEDLVSVAEDLRIARRDLIRVLSVPQAEAVEEKERFVSAIIDPGLVRAVVGGGN